MSRPRVVVAEADQAAARSLASSLEERGLVAIVAADGEQALELVAGREPVVIASDVALPRLNGYQLCRRLTAEHPAVAVVLFSSKDEPADRLWASEVGALALFHKPNQLSRLVDRVVEIANAT